MSASGDRKNGSTAWREAARQGSTIVWILNAKSSIFELFKVIPVESESIQNCKQRGNSVRMDWLYLSRWSIMGLQINCRCWFVCLRDSWKPRTTDVFVNSSGPSTRTWRRLSVFHWAAANGHTQNDMETESRSSLLVQSENRAKLRSVILANNFRHYTQRLGASRLIDQSGKKKPRIVLPKNPAWNTGYTKGCLASQLAARSSKPRKTWCNSSYTGTPNRHSISGSAPGTIRWRRKSEEMDFKSCASNSDRSWQGRVDWIIITEQLQQPVHAPQRRREDENLVAGQRGRIRIMRIV